MKMVQVTKTVTGMTLLEIVLSSEEIERLNQQDQGFIDNLVDSFRDVARSENGFRFTTISPDLQGSLIFTNRELYCRFGQMSYITQIRLINGIKKTLTDNDACVITFEVPWSGSTKKNLLVTRCDRDGSTTSLVRLSLMFQVISQ